MGVFERLSLKEVRVNYKKQFYNANGKIDWTDKVIYFFLPWVLAILLAYIKIPDDNFKNLIGVSLSVLLGLFLNIVVLLISSISKPQKEISLSNQLLRLKVFKEAIFVILFAVSKCISALILLFLYEFIIVSNKDFVTIFKLWTSLDINYLILFTITILFYRIVIQSFISFYVVIRSLISLFKVDIKVEEMVVKEEIRNEEV